MRHLQDGKEAFQLWKPNLIYVQGGNTFWLYHCIEKGGWGPHIIKACTGDDAAVYCGTSAGAIIMGQSIATACWKVRRADARDCVTGRSLCLSHDSTFRMNIAMGRPFIGTQPRKLRGLERCRRISPGRTCIVLPTHE